MTAPEPERPATADDPLVAELRERISEVDRALLAGVNRRLEIVRRLHEHKRAHAIPLRDPDRESTLVERLVAENGGPLSAHGVAEFFEYLLALTRRELHGG